MTTDTSAVIDLAVTQERYPAYHPSHGTPDPMVRRALTLRVAAATARFEQTDYGHPGRFNAWAPRGIDGPLQARSDDLQRLCDAIAALLD
ncbi:MAG: hypothetical protein ACYDEB_03570 [Dehalococcoidia bacterium]